MVDVTGAELPFVKGFRTPRGAYIYDVNTNSVFRVGEAVFDSLDAGTSEAELRARHGEERAADAARLIRARQAEGVFSASRPRRLRFPLSKEGLETRLEGELNAVTLCLTEACNLRCAYCVYNGTYEGYRAHGARSMTFETARKAVDLVLDHSRPGAPINISFYGGEPLLRIDLIEGVMRYAARRRPHGVRFGLTTNGTLLEGVAADTLAEYRVNALVSLDGPQAIHDRSRLTVKGHATHAEVIANLVALKERRPDYFRDHVSIRATWADAGDLPAMRAFFAENASLFSGLPISVGSTSSADASDLAGMNGMAKAVVEDYAAGRRPDEFLLALFQLDLARFHQRPIHPLGDEVYPNGICVPGLRKTFCTMDGRLLVCERVAEGLVIGDVETGIDAGRVHELAVRFAELGSERCRSCWAVRLCKVCFSHTEPDGEAPERSWAVCGYVRSHLEYVMSIYCAIGEANEGALAAFDDVSLA